MTAHALTPLYSIALAAILLAGSRANASTTLYSTDFSEFTAGPDQLAGHHGWLASHENEGLHGIDEDIYVGRERSAFLGATAPSDGASLVRVHHTIDPLEALGAPLTRLDFEVLFGVAASFEGGEDTFSFSFYADTGELLAAIHFDTSEFDYGIWTDDGTALIDTGESFLTDFLHHLHVTIDLESNLWEIELDGIPIFDAQTFTAAGAGLEPITIGALAAEWRISEPENPGDNWLLFDDWTVSGATPTEPAPVPDSVEISHLPDGHLELRWPGEPGARYQVHASTDGLTWTPHGDPIALGGVAQTTRFIVAPSDLSPAVQLYRVEPLDSQP